MKTIKLTIRGQDADKAKAFLLIASEKFAKALPAGFALARGRGNCGNLLKRCD